MVKKGWVYGVCIRNRWMKFAREDELTYESKSILLTLGYKKRGPYLVKTL